MTYDLSLPQVKAWQAAYAKMPDGWPITPPPHWILLPFNEVVPPVHKLFSRKHGWLPATKFASMHTPIFARPFDNVLAIAVPDPNNLPEGHS